MHRFSEATQHNSKRVQTAICEKTSGVLRNKTVKSAGRECRHFEGRNKFSPSQGCHSGSTSRRIKEGILQPVFSDPKKRGRHTSYFRPQNLKQSPEKIQIQNADTQIPAPFYTKRRLVHLNRYERCAFPYSDPSSAQTIPKVCFPGQDIRIQGSSVLPVPSTLHFYKMCGSSTNTTETTGGKDISVSGRLVNLRQVKGGGRSAYKGSVNAFECSGFCSKPEEELVNSDSVNSISGFKPKLSSLQGNPVRTEAGECKELCKSVSSGENSLFSIVSEAAGPHGVCHSSSAFGATVHERFSEMGCFSEIKSLQTFTQKGAGLSPMPKGTAHLAKQGIPDGRNGNGSSLRSQGGHHRCLLNGLGSDNGGTTYEWGRDRISQSNAYKLSGTPCSFSGPQTLPSTDNRLSCVSQIRQHNGGCLYKQARGCQIEESACLGKNNNVMEQKALAVSQSDTCARPDEYRGGPVVEGESSPGGMEAPPRSSSGNMAQIWTGKGGSVCLRGEHTLFPLLLTKGDGCTTRDGCISTSLARDPVLCFPTGKPYPPHTVQNQITEGEGASNSPVMAREDMDSGYSSTAVFASMASSSAQRSPLSGRGENFSSTSREVESLGLARERSNRNAWGLPPNLIATIQSARADSTRSLYEAKWKKF